MNDLPTLFDCNISVASAALPARRNGETLAAYVLRLVYEEAEKDIGEPCTDRTLRALEVRILALLRLLEDGGIIRAADGGQLEVTAVAGGTRYRPAVKVRIYPDVQVLDSADAPGAD